MPSPTITGYVLLTLWGWPGVLAVLLASWHLAERHFRWRRRLSGHGKLAVAAAGLAVGLAFGGRGWSLPADDRALGEEIERRRRESAASRVSPRERLDAEPIADRLRRDLHTDSGR